MLLYKNTEHQLKQIEVINEIDDQIKNHALNFSTVPPVADYAADLRMSLTSVHFPSQSLMNKIQAEIIQQLQSISPEHFYYPNESLHMTIKNIRVINDPPHYTNDELEKVVDVFERVVPNHKAFKVYFYRLLLFPHNLALIGTTDPELDDLVLDLDQQLITAGVPDDKKYLNARHFFSNVTLARFNQPPSAHFIEQVRKISEALNFEPYLVDSVSLVECNAVFAKKNLLKTWQLLP